MATKEKDTTRNGGRGAAGERAPLHRDPEDALHAQDDFLAVVSHELRTPLTAIIGYAELLELGIPEKLTERQREQVERIEISARHLQNLIEEILAVASLRSGADRVHRERVEIAELLHDAEVITRPLADEKGVALEMEPAPEGLTVESDAHKLLQVLLNLLSNAVKFTDEGSVRVSTQREGAGVKVRVADTGIGIDLEQRERIFEPFWQVEQPITRKTGGTGLGLTISRRLIELLGGTLEVESTPGEGSVFTVRIPLCLPDEPSSPAS
ncbi:MAG TPA: HAMP domain-containing sensor histidine kinase [Longimicrobiaceae bacterium]|nr:HAMP domain-containing sensor histidine kinase [Longimicrobiaceae bacterium]